MREAVSPRERPWRTTLFHTGYGDGYGGKVPIGVERVEVVTQQPSVKARWGVARFEVAGWEDMSASTASEAIFELLHLYDLADGFRSVKLPKPKRAASRAKKSPSPSSSSAPKSPAEVGAQAAPDLAKGDRVRSTAGLEGEVFWLGPSKFGPGQPVGVRDASGETHWLDADDVEAID